MFPGWERGVHPCAARRPLLSLEVSWLSLPVVPNQLRALEKASRSPLAWRPSTVTPAPVSALPGEASRLPPPPLPFVSLHLWRTFSVQGPLCSCSTVTPTAGSYGEECVVGVFRQIQTHRHLPVPGARPLSWESLGQCWFNNCI